MYESVTHKIRVRVTPEYVSDQSEPGDSYFFWSYKVEITNLGTDTVQLKTRHWKITDANGRTEEVRGPGSWASSRCSNREKASPTARDVR